jgi:hypothetical protein
MTIGNVLIDDELIPEHPSMSCPGVMRSRVQAGAELAPTVMSKVVVAGGTRRDLGGIPGLVRPPLPVTAITKLGFQNLLHLYRPRKKRRCSLVARRAKSRNKSWWAGDEFCGSSYVFNTLGLYS